MLSIGSMSVAELADAPGIVLDVDDTLTCHGVLQIEALEALHQIRALGRRAALVTGRPIGWAETLAAVLPVDLAVGENGAGWAFVQETGGARRLERGRFESEGEASERARRSSALFEEVALRHPEVRLASDHPLRMCDLAFDVGESVKLGAAQIAALRATCEAEGAQVVVSSVHLHAAFGGWDKAEGMARAAQHVLGVSNGELFDRWIFCGDSGNDAPAFARFRRTVGVANVMEHLVSLPVPPRYRTAEARGRGVRELVDRWTLAVQSKGPRTGAEA